MGQETALRAGTFLLNYNGCHVFSKLQQLHFKLMFCLRTVSAGRRSVSLGLVLAEAYDLLYSYSFLCPELVLQKWLVVANFLHMALTIVGKPCLLRPYLKRLG